MRNDGVKLTLLLIWFNAMLLWPNMGSVKFLNSELLHGTPDAAVRPVEVAFDA